MKRNQEKQNLQDMSVSDLKEQLENTRRELFNVRLNAAAAHIKDYSQFKKLRRTIARILTVIEQKDAGTHSDVQSK